MIRPSCCPWSTRSHLSSGREDGRADPANARPNYTPTRPTTPRRITPRIARRGIDPSERLGRHRWVVERTFAWLNGFRRLRVRYERRADMHHAFLLLACSLICAKRLHNGFC